MCKWIQSWLLNIIILSLEPTDAPRDFTVLKTFSQRISLSWAAVTKSDRNGIITGYKVVYQALPNGGSLTVNVSVGEEEGPTTTTLSGLNQFTNYSISVLAFTVKGDGPPSPSIVAQTREDSKSHKDLNHLVEILLIHSFGMQFVPTILVTPRPNTIWALVCGNNKGIFCTLYVPMGGKT